MAADDRVTKPGAPERWRQIVTYKPGEDGQVHSVRDDGFTDSNLVHDVAWQVIHRNAADAWQQVKAGRKSPLFYHMVASLLNPDMLAQLVGMWRWRVRRHLRPDVFAGLPPALLQKYAGALRLTVEGLKTLPSEPPPVSPAHAGADDGIARQSLAGAGVDPGGSMDPPSPGTGG